MSYVFLYLEQGINTDNLFQGQFVQGEFLKQ